MPKTEEETKEQVCPFCGAGLDEWKDDKEYYCGTPVSEMSRLRHRLCYEREIRTLRKQND